MATTTATLYIPIRTVSGLFSATVTAAPDKKRWRPASSVPVVDKDGMINRPWLEFFDYIAEKKLGGANGSTIPQVEATITYAQVQSLLASFIANAAGHLGVANAQSLSAVVQTVQSAALPGADQIPPVQLQLDTAGAGGE